jgi:hypothetical protein
LGTLPQIGLRLVQSLGGTDTSISITSSGVYSLKVTTNDTGILYLSFETRAVFGGDGTSTGTVTVDNIQAENPLGRSDTTTPSEYVPTTTAAAAKSYANVNGNSVASNVVTEAVGAPLASVPYLLAHPAATNSLTYSLPDTTNWSLTEGSAGDLVTNGDFATDSDWTKGTGWSIGSGVATHSSGSDTSYLTQTALTVGKYYKYSVDAVSAVDATNFFQLYSAGVIANFQSGAGTYTGYFKADGTSLRIRSVSPSADVVVDNVIVRPAVIEQTTTGMDGASDSAVILTDDDGAATEFIFRNLTVPDDSNTHVMRVFIKKDSDETRFPDFGFDLNGGTQQRVRVSLNTATGATAVRAGFPVGTADYEVRDAGDWWEVLCSLANNGTGNTQARIYLQPAVSDTLGTSNTAATGSITLHSCELHENTSIAAIRGMPPLPRTSGAAVTVNTTDYSFDDANHDDAQGAWFAEVMDLGSGSNLGYLGLGTDGRLFFRNGTGTTTYKAYDGNGVSNIVGPSVTFSVDTLEKLGLAYDSSNARLNHDGVWGAENTDVDGTWDNAHGEIRILRSQTFAGACPNSALIRNLRRYDLDYTAAHAKIDELMLNSFSWLGADDTRYSPSVARFRDADGTISTTPWAFKDADGTDYTVN